MECAVTGNSRRERLYFPQRLNNPRLSAGQDWKAAVDENFLLIYNADFKPGQTYTVELDIN